MRTSAPSIARQFCPSFDRHHKAYRNAIVIPFPSRTAANGASSVSGSMPHHTTQNGGLQ